MSKAKGLQVLSPKSLSFDEMLAWIKGQADKAAAMCRDAETHYHRLQTYHRSISEIIAEAVELRSKPGDHREEIEELGNVAGEVFEAINAINSNATDSQMAGGVTIEEAEREILGEELTVARDEHAASTAKFLAAYNWHKARLGLKNRSEVASRTGINERYISEIESGKHKPQFKTIKKIADGFGVDIKEFI